MDAQGRITAWIEWRDGSLYLWKKGDTIRRMGRLVETNYKEGFVKFTNSTFPEGLKVWDWIGRYIDAGEYMDSISIGRKYHGVHPSKESRFTSEASLKHAVHQHQVISSDRRYHTANRSHNCGNCVFYDAPFERCGLSQNERFTEITPDKWCQYWQAKDSWNRWNRKNHGGY